MKYIEEDQQLQQHIMYLDKAVVVHHTKSRGEWVTRKI